MTGAWISLWRLERSTGYHRDRLHRCADREGIPVRRDGGPRRIPWDQVDRLEEAMVRWIIRPGRRIHRDSDPRLNPLGHRFLFRRKRRWRYHLPPRAGGKPASTSSGSTTAAPA